MRVFLLAAITWFSFVGQAVRAAPPAPRSLAGEWRFQLDPSDAGIPAEWFSRPLKDRISLPGSLQAQGFGDEISTSTPWVAALPRDMRWYALPQYQAYTKPGNVKVPYLSQPARHYLGAAWYQRDIEVDAAAQGQRTVLTLERPRWETTLWVDAKRIGSCRSLVAPHVYDLGTLPPGPHRLTLRIDNRMILPYRPDGHSVSDAEGQTWNGIAGAIELATTTPVWIDDAQVYPDVATKTARVHVHIGNTTGRGGKGTLSAGRTQVPVTWTPEGAEADVQVPLGPDATPWSEFNPALQHLALHLAGDNVDDSRTLTFGLRQLRTDGRRILLNDVPLNIRGTHDGGGFPLTGYPATDVESWKRIISTCKAWGLNAMRFHSWCPPDAAFAAADELGFYLQPECGMWNAFDREGHMLEVLNDETARLVRAYGNHPSFLFLAATNEPAGNYKAQLPSWDKAWRQRDPRHLYADGSGRPAQSATRPSDADFFVSADAGLSGRVRGPRGWFGNDYEPSLADVRHPVVTHELGQWCAYPDFDVIRKFTGYLRPGNYEIFRDSAAAHGLLEDNHRLARASGRFQLACYKEEIEANLRTPSLSGFELLDLHDYLGQGTALIGVLDAFWEPKGYATPDEFSRFCGPTVPLARLRQRVYTTTDTLSADVELAHFGPVPLASVTPRWSIRDVAGKTLKSGELPSRPAPIGKNIALGTVKADLSSLPVPAAYKLVVEVPEAKAQNDWNFWLYPPVADAPAPADVIITSSWPDAERALTAGRKVLFQPAQADLGPEDPPLSTTPIFWNRLMNPNGTAFLGLSCDPAHPALAGFPTEDCCDWQWVEAARSARALNLDRLPRSLHPIVQPIDDWNRNFKLALAYECRASSGRLLACSVDLASPTPTARALRASLLAYMTSPRFTPAVEVPLTELRNQWTSTRDPKAGQGPSTHPAQPQAPEIDAAPDAALPTTRPK